MSLTTSKHIDYAIPAKAHTPMYLMHKWWARKPYNVVSEHIQACSQPNEIVLDPFAGSGVTAIEAIKTGRKAIAIDLDPIASFITRMTAIPVDINKIKETYEILRKEVRSQILRYYISTCSKCGNKAIIICSIWKTGNEFPNEIRLYCRYCKKYIHKKPDISDIKRIKAINRQQIPFWYPDSILYYKNGRPFMKKEKTEKLSELFTKRNLICLSILLNEIEKIPDPLMRDLFKFRFTSMVHLGSRLTPVRPTRPYSSFWGAAHSYWVPNTFMESNIWTLYKSAIKGRQGLIVGKEDANMQIKYYKEAIDFEDLNNNSNIQVLTKNVLDLTQNIPPNSIDYVFTDPPYGGSIQYFELSLLWCSWLRLNLDFNGEITINRNQEKNFEYYHKMLRASFEQIYQVLKPDRYVTVTFHNTDIKIYNSILKAVVLAGFDLEKIVYQPPARPSAKMLLQPYGSAVGDYYIHFHKPLSERGELTAAEVDKSKYERIVLETVKRVIAERGEPTPYSIIINSYPIIYDELKKNGYLLSAPESIDDVLNNALGEELVLIPVKNVKSKTIGKLWWFKEPSKIPYIERVPLRERIEVAVVDVLNRLIMASFDDILREIFLKFPNSLTPETESIRSIIMEYGERTKDGRWRLKSIVQQREKQHNEIIEMLCNLGEGLKYQVYGDTPNRRKPLSFPIPKPNLDRVKEIDVLWYRDDKIEYSFEVESTTGITEAIIRGANIPYSVKRFIIIPDEREGILAHKIEEPALRDRIVEDGWKFVFFDDFFAFSYKSKHRKSIQPSDIDALSKTPKVRFSKNRSINDFL